MKSKPTTPDLAAPPALALAGLAGLVILPYFVERGDFLFALQICLAAAAAAGGAWALARMRRRSDSATAGMEQALRELEAKGAELLKAEEELTRGERLRVLGELSGELAHEIQNPLSSIKGAAEILTDRCERKCGTGEFFEILMGEIKRLRGVLDRFLDFARNQDTESPVCDAVKSFQDVARLVKHQMDKHRIRLSLDAPTEGCAAKISDEQLKQVFLNLVLNAIQAMPEGGEILARFEENGETLGVTVRDTGPGVKEKDRIQVFTPFFTTKRGGTGLGLSIVWRILVKHGGAIDLAPRDETAPGACFLISLPRARDRETIVSKADD